LGYLEIASRLPMTGILHYINNSSPHNFIYGDKMWGLRMSTKRM